MSMFDLPPIAATVREPESELDKTLYPGGLLRGSGDSAAPGLPTRDLPLLRTLLELLPAGAYTCDADGLITYYNRHALALWGRAPELNEPIDRY